MFSLRSLVVLVAAAFFVYCEVDLTKERSKIYIRGFFCNASEKFIYKNYSCFAKSHNRTFSGLNTKTTAKYPLYNITVRGTLFYKYGTIYREVLHTPYIDVCEMLSTMKSDNLMIKFFIDNIKDYPSEFKNMQCPFTEFQAKNIPIKFNRFAGITPSGDYKFIQNYTILSEWMMSSVIYSTCNSSIKTSYG